MPRNPAWTRDELILALDLYFRVNPLHNSEKHQEIVRLSRILNELPLTTDRPDRERFRNPNGVYMKLCNFLRLDPDYPGSGLDAGGKLEIAIWEEFVHDKRRLRETAEAIVQFRGLGVKSQDSREDEEEDFPEGRILYRLHRLRERNPEAVRQKKRRYVAQYGCLRCEVCGFSFEETYGEVGKGFIECHHLVPVSQMSEDQRTRPSDLVLVCANCHRMLHRRRPWLSVGELHSLVSRNHGGMFAVGCQRQP